MASDQEFDANAFTKPFQLTKSMRRELYPAIDPSNSMLNASGRVVIITGAGGGIGAAVAHAWTTAGAAGIVLVGRKADALNIVAKEIKDISAAIPAIVVPTDITSESDVKNLYEKVKQRFGKADVLINSAGTMNMAPMASLEPVVWWQDFEVNLKGTFTMIHHFAKQIGDSKGTVINLVSVGASLRVPGISSYSASKISTISLGEFIHIEYPNLRVFSVHPGIVEIPEGANRGAVVPAFMPFAKDKGVLTGGLSLYLTTPSAEYLKGGFVSVNWDVNEMEEHKAEILEKRLTSLGFLNAQLGPEGHPWATRG